MVSRTAEVNGVAHAPRSTSKEHARYSRTGCAAEVNVVVCTPWSTSAIHNAQVDGVAHAPVEGKRTFVLEVIM